jgi:hypothetical protein
LKSQLTTAATAIAAACTVLGYGAPASAQPPPPAPAPAPAALPPPAPGPTPVYVVAPPPIDWEPGSPIPPGYKEVTKYRTGLVIGGAVTFGVVWIPTAVVTSFVVAAGGTATRAWPLFIPVVGPFISIGTLGLGGSGCAGGNAGLCALADFWLVFDGLVQAAGAGMLIGGLAAPKHVLVPLGSAKIDVRPTPLSFGKSGTGFGFTGTF